MQRFFIAFLLLLISPQSWAHNGELLAIDNVSVTAPCDHIYFDFQVENVEGILLKDVKISLMAGDRELAVKKYARFPMDRYTAVSIAVDAGAMKGVDPRTIRIDVSEIFGIKQDWGGWHGIDPSVANYNDIGDYEIYADAPWRMNIYDEDDQPLPVPINVVAHDGDQIAFGNNRPHLEFIDIYIKRASDPDFLLPLNFSALSSEAFDDLFTAKSTDNLAVGIQAFDQSLASADLTHTIAFHEKQNASQGYNYTDLKNSWWFATLMLPPSYLPGFSDADPLDIKVQFTLRKSGGQPYTRTTYLRVFRSPEPLPKIPGFYRGDTHVHTYYSQSIIEFGGPLAAHKVAAKAIGIDWFITTDHTSDFDNWKGGNIADAWSRLGAEVIEQNETDPSVIMIRGQEVSLLNSQGELIHFLAYPGVETPRDLPYLGDGGGDIQLTGVTAFNTLKRLDEYDGFAYAAHPFASKDKLPAVGGLWNVGHPDFPFTGQFFEEGGQVLCNKPGEPSDVFSNRQEDIVFNNLKGAQIWGVRYSLSGTTDPYDPYNLKNGGTPILSAAPNDETNYLRRYRQGEEVVNFVNKKALQMKNADPSLNNFKFYYSAGTDAHGSFNYSNNSGFGTIFTDDEEVQTENTAFGNITCVTYCPEGVGAEGQHALKAMRDGNFLVSDGPLVVIEASNSKTDPANGILMGMDATFEASDLGNIYLDLQYRSTGEFGALDFLKIFVGTEEGESSFELTGLEAYDDSESFEVQDLLSRAGLTVEYDKFFYVRAEVQTEAVYGTGSPRILERENFHAFTNPIWLKFNSPATAVSEELARAFSIYPNPTDRVLKLSGDVAFDALSVFDAEGKLMFRKTTSQRTLDVSELPAGSYTLVVEAGAAKAAKTFVVF